jgi:hypothetical protein
VLLRFGVIAEGPSDQPVIENILLGFFQDEEEEPVINPIQPPPATASTPAPPGGWSLVFESLKRGDPQKALQFNDYLVIHIDTDVQEEPGFDVPRREGGNELSIPDRVERIIARLATEIDQEFFKTDGHRILFAIAVDSIECWLLPLLYKNKKAEKTTGCLDAANYELRRTEKDGLSAPNGTKFPTAYDDASRGYLKRKTLMKHRDQNPSLKLFVEKLDALQSKLNANRPAASQGPGNAAVEEVKPPENS